MKTTQDNFHPMRGHVVDGCEITMRNGDICTIKASIHGWELLNPKGLIVGVPTKSAHVLACLVERYPLEEL